MYTYIAALIKWRKFILAAAFTFAVASSIIALVLPKWYTATTSVFPPEPKSSMSSYAQILQSLQAPILGPTALGARPATIYIDIMKSRRVGEKIINDFGFKEIYRTRLMEDALRVLHSHMSFSLLENGLLKMSFEDRDPERAAKVTNEMVRLLDQFNRELNTTRAARTREFIEKQINVHKEELSRAEEELRIFQEKNQAIELDEQTRSAIEIVTDLTANAISLEVELEILDKYTSKASEEYKRKRQEYEEVVKQLEKFKVDSTRSDGDVVRAYFPTFDKVPEVSLNYARLLRRVKVGEKVYELLVKEYEQARIEEARDTPTVQVLDAATAPELRSRPKRKQIVFIGTLVGFAWASLIAILSVVWAERTRQTPEIREIISPFIEDFKRIFRR